MFLLVLLQMDIAVGSRKSFTLRCGHLHIYHVVPGAGATLLDDTDAI